MKITDVVSTGDFDHEISGRIFKLRPFTLQAIAELEEQGIAWTEIGEFLQKSPVVGNVTLFWAALTPECRAEYGDDIKTLRSSLTVQSLSGIVDAIGEAIRRSSPPQEEVEEEKKIIKKRPKG